MKDENETKEQLTNELTELRQRIAELEKSEKTSSKLDKIGKTYKYEEEIERLQQRQEQILNAAGEGIYGLDSEGRVIFVNPAAARMVGWETDNLIGQKMHNVLHHSKSDGTAYPKEQCPRGLVNRCVKSI